MNSFFKMIIYDIIAIIITRILLPPDYTLRVIIILVLIINLIINLILFLIEKIMITLSNKNKKKVSKWIKKVVL